MKTVRLAARVVLASASARTITGTALTYSTHANASTGPVIIDPGAIHMAADLSRVKLLIDHDQRQPVGYLTAATDTDEDLSVVFHVPEGEAGDRALTEAASGLRDGLSVGVWADEDGYTFDDDLTLHITSGTLREVSLCAIPAIDDARVTDVAASAHRLEGITMPPVTPAAPVVETPPAPVQQAAPEAAPQAPAPVVQQAAPVMPPGGQYAAVTLAQARDLIAGLIRTSPDAAHVNAALADIIPSADGGQGFMRPQWLDELWTPVANRRRLIESIQRATLTSGTRVYGWKWETRPEVDDYEGNKTEIPTSEVKIVPAEAQVTRVAGGWDVDRIFVDLGEPGFLEALFRAAVEDYLRKTEAKVAAFLLANATLDGTAPTLVAGLALAASQLMLRGAEATFFAFSSDLWEDYLAIKASDAPWWLSRSSTVSLGSSETTLADLNAWAETSLPAGTILAGDRRSATYYEPNGQPLRVQAENIPKGGVDIAVFAYQAIIVNDKRGLSRISVVPPVEGAAIQSLELPPVPPAAPEA